MKQLPKERIHEYWRKPGDAGNQPEAYLKPQERSVFLVGLVRKYASPEARIMEIGCNVGRNLHHLYASGFRNLEGDEISEEAVRQLRLAYPELAEHLTLYNAPAEDVLPKLEDRRYDLTFTMAVLEHIHYDSEWVFPHIARITKGVLITIEDEKTVSEHHFPRNYAKVFEGLGMRQIEKVSGRRIPGLESRYFVARVFQHRP